MCCPITKILVCRFGFLQNQDEKKKLYSLQINKINIEPGPARRYLINFTVLNCCLSVRPVIQISCKFSHISLLLLQLCYLFPCN